MDHCAPVKLSAWTAKESEQVARAVGDKITQELRADWQAGKLAMFRTQTALAVVEAVKDENGLALIVHVLSGKNGAPFIFWLCDFASKKNISRISATAITASRARLYLRWGRALKNQGVIWAAAAVNKQPQQPLTKIIFSVTTKAVPK